jgi:hypothetical protein
VPSAIKAVERLPLPFLLRARLIAFTQEQVCSQNLLRDFAAACRKMSPLVEFPTKAFGLKY